MDCASKQVIEVCFREAGGSIHASSDELKGLHVVGTNREEVCGDVISAIEFMFRELRGQPVTVEWVDSPLAERTFERFIMEPGLRAAA